MTNQDQMLDDDLALMNQPTEEMQPQAGSVEAIDPLDRMPPGHSLTQPKGKWAWDQPSRFTDPEEAIDFVIDKLEEPAVEKDMLKLMLSGISIEEMVETIAIGGFSTGHYTPDVAELIKAPIGMYLAGLAVENDIPPKLFNSATGMPRESENVTDEQAINIMKGRNPERVEALQKGLEEEEMLAMQQQDVAENSFLAPELDQQPTQEIPNVVA
tara:strand:- start:456 stop:1094 length:639 start_codon:yes stop_codon:yes gene_type:complete